MITKATLDFLKELKANNNREWFADNMDTFRANEKAVKVFFNILNDRLQTIDSIEKLQVFRIYRDIRFSKDKTPYKQFFSAWYSRTKPLLRGSYYVHIEPGSSFVEGGFWEPNPADLLRIRKEVEFDDSYITQITQQEQFKKYFGQIEGAEVKTAPKGFDKNHTAIGLIRKKQFIITRKFTDREVLSPGFADEVLRTFAAMRPFFDYMSDVLTTNLNGESLYE